jgi:hypothetical protein
LLPAACFSSRTTAFAKLYASEEEHTLTKPKTQGTKKRQVNVK